MNETQKTFHVDEEAQTLVLSIIHEAQKHAILVTPYVDLWGHAQNAISVAVKRGVKLEAIVRAEPKVTESDGVRWLVSNGVEVRAVDKLHAKIYLNEKAVVLSSMNLTEYSAKNSLEIAWVVRDRQVEQQVRAYVKDRLGSLAKSLPSVPREPVSQTVTQPRNAYFTSSDGACIRCGRSIALNRNKPLCEDCYDVWAVYEDDEYPEKFCHVCGRPAPVSYARPLCRDCF